MPSQQSRLRRGVPSCSQLFLSLGVIVSLCGTLTNCGLSGNRDNKGEREANYKEGTGNREQTKGGEEKEDPPPLRVVGEIASVHPAENFVLIKRYLQAGGFGPGTLIASISPQGQACSLILTGEILGRYYAADIQDGKPRRGDMVVARDLPEEDEEHSKAVRGAPGEEKRPSG